MIQCFFENSFSLLKLRKLFLVVSFAFLLQQNDLRADSYYPVEICEIVFGENGFNYEEILPFCCEMHSVNFRDSSLGQMLPVGTGRSYELLEKTDERAVVSVSLNIDKEFQNFYVFMKNIDSWKIFAIRTLAQTLVIQQALTEVENLPADSALSLITKHGYDDLDKYINRNRLLLSSDNNLEEYFNKNQSKFKEIADYILEKGFYMHISSINQVNSDELIKTKLENLLIEKIVPAEEGEFIGFMIGGILDNTAGYFYQPDPEKVPKMSTELYIMIKHLGNGWYLYKTT